MLKKLGSKPASFHAFSIVWGPNPWKTIWVKNMLKTQPSLESDCCYFQFWDDGPVYHMHGGKALAAAKRRNHAKGKEVHQIMSDSNGSERCKGSTHASKARNGENMVCFKCVFRQATKQSGKIKIWKFPKCSRKPQVPRMKVPCILGHNMSHRAASG